MTNGTATTQQPLVVHRSYSQVRQLRTCGWSYKLERLDRVPSRPSAPAVAGVAVHTGTEAVDHDLTGPLVCDQPGSDHVIARHRRTSKYSREELVERGVKAAHAALDVEIEKYFAKGWQPSEWKKYGRATIEKPQAEDIEWFRRAGIPQSIQAYVDWRLDNDDFQVVDIPKFGPAIEVPFNYYIDGQLIHGFIDRIFTSRKQGGYYPVDLKSGQKPKTDEQLGLYAAALRMALGWEIEWGYYLYGLKTGTAKLTQPLSLTHWSDEKLGSVYLPATKAIQEGIFIPNPGENCMHCSVSAQCEYVQSVV